MTKASQPLPPDDHDDDQEQPAPPPQGGSKVYRTRTGELIGTTTEAVQTMAKFSPTQAITVLVILLVGFICITQSFQAWSDREERRSAAVERAAATATTIRENNAQVELTRTHCVRESDSLRSFFADQSDKRMRFEAEERSKDRAVLARMTDEKAKETLSLNAILASFEELKKILLKKNEEECPLPPRNLTVPDDHPKVGPG